MDDGASWIPKETVLAKSPVLYICLAFFPIGAAAADLPSPYAGQETREIKALAPDDIEAYLSGEGMGFAKAAELNGYPGPAHVLALASELQLTSDQEQRTRILFDDMHAKAQALGRLLIAQERELDQQFASKVITQESLAALTKHIGELQAQVRAIHLEAHLAQLAILTPLQAAKYVELRGYASVSPYDGHAHMH